MSTPAKNVPMEVVYYQKQVGDLGAIFGCKHALAPRLFDESDCRPTFCGEKCCLGHDVVSTLNQHNSDSFDIVRAGLDRVEKVPKPCQHFSN